MSKQQPLTDTANLPRFGELNAADVVPRITQLTDDNRQRVEQLLEIEDPCFDTLIEPLEQLDHRLMAAWSPVSHMQMVDNDPAWRDAHGQALEVLTAYSTEMGQNVALYRAVQRVADRAEVKADPLRSRLLANRLREFRKAGVGLDGEAKARFRELMSELAGLTTRFAQNVQDATDQWSFHTDNREDLNGLPDNLVEAARQRARDARQGGYRLTLDMPTYQAVMTLAELPALREQFYTAWVTRASDEGPLAGQFDNKPLIDGILARRHEAARLVGFGNYAEYALDGRMAESTDDVLAFLNDLADKSRAAGLQEFAELERFAGHALQPWDVGFYGENLKEARYSVSDELLKPYFPADRVVAGLFELAAELYQLQISEVPDIEVWHDEVRYYRVATRSGTLIGGFYADLYAREGKRAGAWIDECVIRARVGDTQALPVGYLVCNFTAAGTSDVAELGHSEIVTLFHEFGHMMHHLLTRIDYPSIAGINGVPWDAVELPSQFMENFAWEYAVLEKLSRHRDTDAALDRALYDKLTASRQFNAALAMLRQLEFALFDFRLHAEYRPGDEGQVQRVIDEVRTTVSLVPVPEWNRFANSFAHIFAGGYAAGYYSYKWAEVLAADAYSALEHRNGALDTDTAQQFRESILEIGGSRNILDAFIEYRGRAPSLAPLLEVSGIQSTG